MIPVRVITNSFNGTDLKSEIDTIGLEALPFKKVIVLVIHSVSCQTRNVPPPFSSQVPNALHHYFQHRVSL
jgi:hypothetical protein